VPRELRDLKLSSQAKKRRTSDLSDLAFVPAFIVTPKTQMLSSEPSVSEHQIQSLVEGVESRLGLNQRNKLNEFLKKHKI